MKNKRTPAPGKAAFFAARAARKSNPQQTSTTPEKKPLFLIMQKIWFEEILSGEKTSEYRKNSDFYKARFVNKDGKFRKYLTVILQEGYHTGARRMTVEVKEIKIGFSFEICLGEILDKNFDLTAGPEPEKPKRQKKAVQIDTKTSAPAEPITAIKIEAPAPVPATRKKGKKDSASKNDLFKRYANYKIKRAQKS